MKKYQTFISENILIKKINFEIFKFPNLNKGYIKINKISLMLFILLRFLVDDFNFDNTLKNNLKKMFSSINEIFLGILDNFILPHINSLMNNPNFNVNSLNPNSNTLELIEKFKENVDKYLYQTKNLNRIKKSKKDFFVSISKSCDSALLVIKNFSR